MADNTNLDENIAWLEQKLRTTNEDFYNEILDPVVVLNYLKAVKKREEKELREEFKARGKTLDDLAESRGWK